MMGSPRNRGGPRRPIVVDRGARGGARGAGGAHSVTPLAASLQRMQQPRRPLCPHPSVWRSAGLARAGLPPRRQSWVPSSSTDASYSPATSVKYSPLDLSCSPCSAASYSPMASAVSYSTLSASAASYSPSTSTVSHSPSGWPLSPSAVSYSPLNTSSSPCSGGTYSPTASPIYSTLSAAAAPYSPVTRAVSYLPCVAFSDSPSSSPPLYSQVYSSSSSPPWSSTRASTWTSPSSTPTATSSSAFWSGDQCPQQQLGQGSMGQEQLLLQLQPYSEASWMQSPQLQQLQQLLQQRQRQESGQVLPKDLPSFGARTAAAAAAAPVSSSSSRSSYSSGCSGSSGSGGMSMMGSQSPDDHLASVESLAAQSQQLSIVPPDQRHASCQEPHNSRTNLRTNISQKPRKAGSSYYCAFCKGNNEMPRQYMSHKLHDKRADGTLVVTCDVLRSLKCDLCGATGDWAHTRSHCPLNRAPSIAVLLKNTPRRCDGTLRKYRGAFRL